jgi:hypothetical protein
MRLLKTTCLISMILMLAACRASTPEPIVIVATLTPIPSPTTPPTITLTPTRAPDCPAPFPEANWLAPADFNGYVTAIQSFLSAGGAADALREQLTKASSIDAQYGGVWPVDLTGDGDLETIVSIFDPAREAVGSLPSGDLLIFGCTNGVDTLLYRDTAGNAAPMVQVREVGDLIGAGRGGQVATVRSECGAHTCFDTFDMLGWDGNAFVSLMGDRLQMPFPTYTLVNRDGDAALELEAVAGQIASVGAGPQRSLTQIWDWNGAQYVLADEFFPPPEYRIHIVNDADDLLASGDFNGALALYERATSDDASILDWETRPGRTQEGDRANPAAYALYRIMIVHVRLGDVDQARADYDRLNAEYPAGEAGDDYRELAQIFWSSYDTSNSLSAACTAVNVFANNDVDALDGLNAYGYANRQYVAVDMCPFV